MPRKHRLRNAPVGIARLGAILGSFLILPFPSWSSQGRAGSSAHCIPQSPLRSRFFCEPGPPRWGLTKPGGRDSLSAKIRRAPGTRGCSVYENCMFRPFFLRQRERTWNSHAHQNPLLPRRTCGKRARERYHKLLKVKVTCCRIMDTARDYPEPIENNGKACVS